MQNVRLAPPTAKALGYRGCMRRERQETKAVIKRAPKRQREQVARNTQPSHSTVGGSAAVRESEA